MGWRSHASEASLKEFQRSKLEQHFENINEAKRNVMDAPCWTAVAIDMLYLKNVFLETPITSGKTNHLGLRYNMAGKARCTINYGSSRSSTGTAAADLVERMSRQIRNFVRDGQWFPSKAYPVDSITNTKILLTWKWAKIKKDRAEPSRRAVETKYAHKTTIALQ